MLHLLGDGDLLALHRTRVASRRLREILPILELDSADAGRLGRKLKTVTVELGSVRELGVLLNLLDELQESGDADAQALRRIKGAIAAAHAEARERLRDQLPIGDVERLARRLAKVAHALRGKKPSRGWQWAIDARVHRRATTVLDALDAAGAIYLQERLHDVRIALKKFRYALEISGEAAGVRPSPDIRVLKRDQETLGRLHDLQILIDRIREIQPAVTPPDVTMWRRIDRVVRALEDECRRLHAKFLRQQPELRAICERVSRATGEPARGRRALAS